MNGFSRGDESFYVTKLKEYKKPVLLMGNKYCLQKVATFNNEMVAEAFCRMLNRWLGLEDKEEEHDYQNKA